MGNRLSPFQQELLEKVNEVMHYIWDPIGVSGVPQARDEYDSYALHIFSMLIYEKKEGEIAESLYQIATENMGFTGSREIKKSCKETEKILCDWRNFLKEKESRSK